MNVNVFTLYPQAFPGYLALSNAGRAMEKGLWSLNTVDIRDYAQDRYRTVDDTPFGGGAGMVMRPDVVDRALADKAAGQLVHLTPRGEVLNQGMARRLAQMPAISILCGHFEGIDQRVIDKWQPLEISVGDYVLSGGEIAAMVLLDCVVRLLPGVLGSEESLREESFNAGLLEYNQYTKPRIWNGASVPDVLANGNHALIGRFRLEQSQATTKQRRPDLWRAYKTNQDQKDEGN